MSGADGQVTLHVLWAKLAEHEASSPYVQFVGAFSDGEVDAWPETYRARRGAMQRWYSDIADVEFYFTTVTDLARPTIPDPDWAEAVFPCAVCRWEESCADGCHS